MTMKRLFAGLRGALTQLAVALVTLQAVIGLVMLFVALCYLWRPAGATLVVGGLLVLHEVVAALRGPRS